MENIRTTNSPAITGQIVAQNKVLKNTYILLSLTLIFSAITSIISIQLKLPHPGILLTLGGYFGLLFLTHKFRNRGLGLIFVFALTGFMGTTLGPILSIYWSTAPQIVMQALGSTALVFLALSGYALISKKNFNFMGSFLMVGILVAFVAGLAAFFLQMPILSLAVSAMFVLLMSGLILYETSQIIHSGETNYISATVTLYVSIYNLFASLLHLLGFASSE